MKSMKRFIYLPDPHGENVNRAAWKIAMDFCKEFKPQRRILGGDLWEFSPFRRGAGQAEQEMSLAADFQAGLDLMEEFKPTDHCLGNHDIRPWRIRDEGKGALADYAALMIAQIETAHNKHKCTSYGYRIDRRCQLGPGLSAIHGFVANMHAAKTTAEAYPGGTMAGHVHSIAYYRAASLDRRECWLTGCLREIFADFNGARFATFRHVHGFAWGWYDERGDDYAVHQAQAMASGKWIIGGQTYGRD